MLGHVRVSLVPVVATALVAAVVGGCTPQAPESVTTVAFVLVGQRDDLGYNQAVWEGADELARALPDVQVVRVEDVPEDETATATMERLVADGADVVFATSFGHRDQALEVARRHPDVVVLHQGATSTDPDVANFGTYFGAHSEAAYGAGVAAGHTTETGVLGFVVAFPIPATFNNVNAFTLGARSVRPDAETHVRFTQDWCDEAAQSTAVAEVLAAGADVVAQHQDCTATVVREAAAGGAAVVGYHADASELAGDRWLVGPVWTWGDLFVDVVESVRRGRFADSPYRAGFVGTVADGDNPFVLTEVGPAAGPRAADELARTMAAFAAGERRAFTGPVVDRDGEVRLTEDETLPQAAVDAMDWWVEGVVGDVP